MPKKFLFLQGPLSPFFSKLSTELKERGHEVHRVCFNGGDSSSSFDGKSVNYVNAFSEWEGFIRYHMMTTKITDLIVYGDTRKYHRVAIEACERLNVKVWVFEEGYLRPNYITLERGGVNANSSFANNDCSEVGEIGKARPLSRFIMMRRACYAFSYYLARAVKSFKFPRYEHHRKGGLARELRRWSWSVIRKPFYVLRDKFSWLYLKKRSEKEAMFVVPLQVHNDSQVLVHSSFRSVEDFIRRVVSSFYLDAPKRSFLVIKNHPMDRGFKNYRKVIADVEDYFGCYGRVFYGHEFSLPELWRYSVGCVTINSTVGISSLIHSVPVKTLGKSVYQASGLVNDIDLHDFWHAPGGVDRSRASAFISNLKVQTQFEGSFYQIEDRLIGEVCDRIVL